MSFVIIDKEERLRKQPDGCGGCDACCIVFGVEELDKPPYTPCTKLLTLGMRNSRNDGGCSVYPDRPPACKDFECMWLKGVFGLQNPHHRPDRLGLIFNLTHPNSIYGQQILTAWEAWEGAADEYQAKEFLLEVSKRCLVIIARRDKPRTMIGPPGLLADAARHLQAYAERKKGGFQSTSDKF